MVVNGLRMSKSKKIIKILLLLVLLFISPIFVGMLSISSKYVNKPLITFDINNIRNPQIKKITRTIDNLYSVMLLKISDEQRKHLDQTLSTRVSSQFHQNSPAMEFYL